MSARAVVVGELALDGSVRSGPSTLGAAVLSARDGIPCVVGRASAQTAPSSSQQTQDEQDQARASSGGAGQTQSNQPTGQGNRRGQNYEQRPMSEEEADRVLSAVEQDERQLTREKLRKGQRRTPVSRDW